MDDWSKALLSAGAGLIAGLVAQPVKYRLMAWTKRRQMKDALYKEMGLNYHLLNRVVDTCHDTRELIKDDDRRDRERAVGFLNSISLGSYEHYSATDKGLFLNLDDAAVIEKLYAKMREATSDRSAPWADRYRSVYDVFAFVKRCQKEGTLDIDLLLKHRAAHRERTVARIERYGAAGGGDLPGAKPADILELILDSQYGPKKL